MAQRGREELGRIIGVGDMTRRVGSAFGHEDEGRMLLFLDSPVQVIRHPSPSPSFQPTHIAWNHFPLNVLVSIRAQYNIQLSTHLLFMSSSDVWLPINITPSAANTQGGRYGLTVFVLRRRRSREIHIMFSVDKRHHCRRHHVTNSTLDRSQLLLQL